MKLILFLLIPFFLLSQSMEFDGNNWLEAGDIIDLGTDDFTLSMWVKNGAGAAAVYPTGKFASTSDYWYIYLADDYLRIISEVGNVLQIDIRDATMPVGTQDAAWHHIFVSVDRDAGTNSVLAIDGVESDGYAAQTVSTTDHNIADPLRIGTRNAAGSFIGNIAFCAYWLGSMGTITDAQAIYNSGSGLDVASGAGALPAPDYYWRLNEGSGTPTCAITGTTLQFGDGSTPATYPAWSTDAPFTISTDTDKGFNRLNRLNTIK